MPKTIVIPASDDLWDEVNGKFVSIKEQTLVVEHSLVSISKWEAKWKKPFLSINGEQKTAEELLDYIRCMTINKVDPRVYSIMPYWVMKEIDDYIADPMTATTFNEVNSHTGREVITSEVIYYQMLSYGIPYEFERWHLNRLITLIRIFAIKNGPQKKMSKAEAAAYQRAINDKRLAKSKARR